MKNIWKALFILTTGITLWLGGKFFYHLYGYLTLSKSTSANVTEWGVQELTDSKFAIFAVYEFDLEASKFGKKFIFTQPLFPNKYVAQSNIEQWKEQNWLVWYSGRNPKISALQKLFPFKAGVHMVLSLGVILYFFWLYEYVKRHNPSINRSSIANITK